MTADEFLHLLCCKPDAARAAIAQDPALLRLKCRSGESPLHFLCTENALTAVNLLLEAGMNVNASNDYGDTPLSSAAGLGLTEITALLLEHGATPNTADDIGFTPLTRAIEDNQLGILDLLLRHGAVPQPTKEFIFEFNSAFYHLDDNQRAETVALLDKHWGEGTCVRLFAEYNQIYNDKSEE